MAGRVMERFGRAVRRISRAGGFTRKTVFKALAVIVAYSLPAYLLAVNYTVNDRHDNFKDEEYGLKVFDSLDENAVVLCRWWSYGLLSHLKHVVLKRDDVTVISRPKSKWVDIVDEFYGKAPVYITFFDEKVASKYELEDFGGVYYVSGKKE